MSELARWNMSSKIHTKISEARLKDFTLVNEGSIYDSVGTSENFTPYYN
jgi:hypothetical protein